MFAINWLNIELIEQKIIDCRKKEFSEIVNSDDYFIYNCLPEIIYKIIEYRNRGIQVLSEEKDPLNILYKLLEIEADVISIIDTAIYSYLDDEKSFELQLSKNKPYIYTDYFNMVSYYAKDFAEFSFLAKFYMLKVTISGN